MGVFLENGTRVTRDTVTTTDHPDKLVVLADDLYSTSAYSVHDPAPEGSLKQLLARAGTVMRVSQLALLFKAPAVAAIVPNRGPEAGGTVIEISGTNLDGVAAVRVGEVEATDVTVVSATKVRAAVPAGEGTQDVTITDANGDEVIAGEFTYAD